MSVEVRWEEKGVGSGEGSCGEGCGWAIGRAGGLEEVAT